MKNNAIDRVAQIYQMMTESDFSMPMEEKEVEEFLSHCEKIFLYNFRRFGCSLSETDREDLFQESLVKLLKCGESYDTNKGMFSTWFNKVCQSVILKHYEELKKQNKYGVTMLPLYAKDEEGEEVNLIDRYSSYISAEDQVLHDQMMEKIWNRVQSLRDNYRQAIILCDFEGYKPSDAAQVMGCKSSNISMYLNRGHAKLRELESEFDDIYER